ncbi:hypothetical protein U1Q18_051162, partial [Sarracenia purpurea var. burkii]
MGIFNSCQSRRLAELRRRNIWRAGAKWKWPRYVINVQGVRVVPLLNEPAIA